MEGRRYGQYHAPAGLYYNRHHFYDAEAGVRLVPAYAPCIVRTHVACRGEAVVRHAVSVVLRDACGASRVRIWKNANTICDEKRN